MKKIVKYNNDLNNLSLRSFSDKELDIFFSIILRMRDEGTNEIEYSFKDLMKHIGVIEYKRFLVYIEHIFDRISGLFYKERTEKHLIRVNLFRTFKIDFENQSTTIKVDEEYKYLLNNLLGDYTKWDFIEFRDLRSTYAKTLFRHLNQFKTTGAFKIALDDFRLLFDIPEAYSTAQITEKIINPCIKELKDHFKGLKVEKIRDGRTIKTLKFTFRKFTNETLETQSGKLISVPVQEEVFTKEEIQNIDTTALMNEARAKEGFEPLKSPLKKISFEEQKLI